jgi:G3E family GTPase
MNNAGWLPVPVTIISGFLGSGKTTLLNHVLHADHGLRIAVLVNDFGAVNIDSALITGVEGETVSLSNGCICCSIRGDLLAAVAAILRRPDLPDAIVIETSGVSQPAAVASTFLQPELEPYLALNAIVTVVDAEQGGPSLDGDFFFLALDQVGVADFVALNKVDLVTPERLAELRHWVHNTVPRARIIETTQGNFPVDLLLDTPMQSQRVFPETEADHSHDAHEAHEHTRAFTTWTWHSDEPLSMRALRQAVERLPLSIYRAKGFVFLADLPEERWLLQVVGRRASLTVDAPWGDAAPQSQLVFIAEAGAPDADAVQSALEGALQRSQPTTDFGRLRRWVHDWVRGGSS